MKFWGKIRNNIIAMPQIISQIKSGWFTFVNMLSLVNNTLIKIKIL